MSNCNKPCKDCPFARHTPPGSLGGAPVEMYLGQIVGPFFLPCHNSPGYDQKKLNFADRQCAGAAIFRANIGVDVLMPEALLHLPAGDLSVFEGPVQFLVHHGKMTWDEANTWLKEHPLERLLVHELAKLEAKFFKIPK